MDANALNAGRPSARRGADDLLEEAHDALAIGELGLVEFLAT
jgi:hypothetical protein